jgi:His Kinase A (phospho-acceptor) domain
MIAHELRRPLTALLGALATVQQRGPALATAQQQELLGIAHRQGTQLQRLLEQLLVADGLDRLHIGMVKASLVDAAALATEAGVAAQLAHPPPSDHHRCCWSAAGPRRPAGHHPHPGQPARQRRRPLPARFADPADRRPRRHPGGAGRPGPGPGHPSRCTRAHLRTVRAGCLARRTRCRWAGPWAVHRPAAGSRQPRPAVRQRPSGRPRGPLGAAPAAGLTPRPCPPDVNRRRRRDAIAGPCHHHPPLPLSQHGWQPSSRSPRWCRIREILQLKRGRAGAGQAGGPRRRQRGGATRRRL